MSWNIRKSTAFQGYALEEDQFDKILETLEQNNVDVLRITDDDDDIPDEELILNEEDRSRYGVY